MKNLDSIKEGKLVRMVSVDGGRSAEQRISDMGLIPGARIKVMHNSGNGPLMINVKAQKIPVKKVQHVMRKLRPAIRLQMN